MRKIWEWIKSNPNRTMFLVPILLVAVISISHVVSWYNIANPLSWAIYLSIAIEVGAMTALVAATNKMKETITLNTSGINYGSGTYEIYSSSTTNIFERRNFFAC